MDRSSQLLKDRIAPEPLIGGNEYKLCTVGFSLNHQHAEAQSRETAANADINEAPDTTTRLEQFEHLKTAVIERQIVMRTQFSHVKDCFICSVAFGLTSAIATKPDRMQFSQLLVRFSRVGWRSR
jgi:hypothetical protein